MVPDSVSAVDRETGATATPVHFVPSTPTDFPAPSTKGTEDQTPRHQGTFSPQVGETFRGRGALSLSRVQPIGGVRGSLVLTSSSGSTPSRT